MGHRVSSYFSTTWGAGVAVGGLGDLEHRAVAAVRPAARCYAEQVAVGVGDEAERKETVGAVETDQGGGGAGIA